MGSGLVALQKSPGRRKTRKQLRRIGRAIRRDMRQISFDADGGSMRPRPTMFPSHSPRGRSIQCMWSLALVAHAMITDAITRKGSSPRHLQTRDRRGGAMFAQSWRLAPTSLARSSPKAMTREAWVMRTIKFNRAISTGQLHALLRVHIRPIDVVVFHGSSREHSFRGGFPA